MALKVNVQDGIIQYSTGDSSIVNFNIIGTLNVTSTITGSNLSGVNTGDQTITLTGDVTGSGTGSFLTTLATVNTSPVNLAFQKLTTNLKGLVTSTTAVTPADINSALGYVPVNKSGDTMIGNLILNADPTTNLGAVTKQYVDNIATGISVHQACETSTTAALPSATYNNGSSGVGATLTAISNGFLNLIGIGGDTTMTVGSRILVKNQVNSIQNGIYVVTNLGSSGTPWILTRASDFDGTPTSEVVSGDLVYIQSGTLIGTQWVQTNVGTGVNTGPSYNYVIIGTDNIIFGQFAGAGSYTAGSGISIASNTISNTGVTSLTAGSNISISGATGAVTINVTGTVPSATTAVNQSGGTVSATTATLSNTLTVNTTAANPSAVAVFTNTGSNGVQLQLNGNGSTTPTKTIRVLNGLFQIINNAYTAASLALDDSGNLSITGGLTATFGTINGPLSSNTVSALTLKAYSVGIGSLNLQAGSAANTGYVEFISAGGIRQGYIGYSTTTASADTGTIPFVMGSAQFSGSINATGSVSALNFNGFTTSQTSGVANRIVVADSSGYISNSYFNGTDEGTNGTAGTVTSILTKRGDNYYRSTSAQSVMNYLINTSNTWPASNSQAFASGSSVGSSGSAGSLWAYSVTGSNTSAAMSFHRGGIYAINMGLDTDNVFRLGGWSDGANVYRFTVDASGNLGARGTITGGVVNSSASINCATNLYVGTSLGIGAASPTGGAGDISIARAGGTTAAIYFGTSGVKYLFYDGTNYQLTGGSLVVSGDITAYSDIRVKTNITVIPDALNKVMSIRGVTFNRTDTNDPEKRYTGVIAQEIEKVLPEVVSESSSDTNVNNAGIKSVAYGNLVGLLIEAIKELNAKVDSLTAQLADEV